MTAAATRLTEKIAACQVRAERACNEKSVAQLEAELATANGQLHETTAMLESLKAHPAVKALIDGVEPR